MGKRVTIIGQLPLTSRQYTRQDGTQDTFHSMGFELTDGIDTFYAELVGDQALACKPLDQTREHTVQCAMRCRPWKDSTGAGTI